MKTREEWKTTIDEIAGLKDKFMKIKDDSESLFSEAKRIFLASLDEAKELADLAKSNMGTVVATFMGQEEIDSAPELNEDSNRESVQKIKVRRAKSKNFDSRSDI